ncbi:hypothetical protein [Kitasatospora brasiliensis]|uniref:hypothetical protein n=1 Tax=Kitasatospora brasiliensis TaxID=3058040 RepID=UPI00292E56DD|nr:hypothetical protein [Kitasatospora sp. K002]
MRSATGGPRPYGPGGEAAEDEYVLGLYRVPVKARTGRKGGPAPRTGRLAAYADGGALRAVLRRLGERALPTLARHEPDLDFSSRIKQPSMAALVREIEQVDRARLPAAEREVLGLLLDWGRRALAEDGALRIVIDAGQ